VQGPDEPGDHDPAAIGIRRAALVAAACALTAATGAAAQAPGRIVALPSPFSPLRPTPPLPGAGTLTETRFPGRLFSSQAVRVSVDGSGTPFRVVDVDRILIATKGDYSFVVAGPVENVRPAPGSSAQPGLRTGAVVWQGFSPTRRTLAAEITLSPRAAASALPLRVEVGQSVLQLTNTTSATAKAVDVRLPTLGVARILDAARGELATDLERRRAGPKRARDRVRASSRARKCPLFRWAVSPHRGGRRTPAVPSPRTGRAKGTRPLCLGSEAGHRPAAAERTDLGRRGPVGPAAERPNTDPPCRQPPARGRARRPVSGASRESGRERPLANLVPLPARESATSGRCRRHERRSRLDRSARDRPRSRGRNRGRAGALGPLMRRGPPRGGPLSSTVSRSYLPRFICQKPCECVAAMSMGLHRPPPLQVGSREDGWIARCMTS
jgi:hypothetical protein